MDFDIEDNMTEKQFWKEYNEKCIICKKECKQSSVVTILNCPLDKVKIGD